MSLIGKNRENSEKNKWYFVSHSQKIWKYWRNYKMSKPLKIFIVLEN